VIWNSTPDGRGRVVERVQAYEVRSGQTLAVEDPRLEGTQTVTFAALDGGGCRLSVELDYALKDRTLFTPLVDALFVRRALNDALRRTLVRFSRELAAGRRADGGFGSITARFSPHVRVQGCRRRRRHHGRRDRPGHRRR
jgi:hypothetical protein